MVQPHIQKLLEDRYYLRDKEGNLLETIPEEMFGRVAHAVADAEISAKAHWEIKFYDLMAKNKFLPNTPTLINAGKEKPGCFSACFTLPVEDSMEGIFTAVKNAAIIMKAGGGVGFNFSHLREKGAIVKSTGHKSSGPVSFMKVFDAACDTISQGGVRRGAMIAILNVDHPDIEEFISCKDDGVSFNNFNISVGITDDFMEAVEKNQNWFGKPARDLWNKIVEHAHKTGDPGLVFLDTINKAHPLDDIVEALNPCGELPLRPFESCIAKGELVLTDTGFIPIEDIITGDWVASLDGKYPCYQQVNNMKFMGTKPIHELLTKEGYKVKATEDHRFLTIDGWKQVKNLKEDDELILGAKDFSIDYRENYEDWELLGWMHGDGWFTENSVGISFNYADGDGPIKDRLLPMFKDWLCKGKDIKPLRDDEISYQLQTEITYAKESLEEYGCKLCKASDRELPSNIWFQPAEAQASFLRGYIAADGGVQGKANSQYKIASSNRKMLEQVQLLLTRFGIGSWISTFSMEKYENRNPQHQLVITGEDAQTLFHRIGFISPKKAEKFNTEQQHKYGKRETVRVASITYVGEEEVYDIEVPNTHNFIVNGLVAHNCNLGSINLMAYMIPNKELGATPYWFDYKELGKDIPTMIRFLDNVIDANPFPLPEIDKASKESRKIGLGIMGWADCLIKMKIPYDSDEAIALAEQLMQFIYVTADEASVQLGEEKGFFPLADEYPIEGKLDQYRRNATLLTVAPTGTLSRIAGVSSGIEPIFAWKTHHKLVDLEYDETHWAYEERLHFHQPEQNKWAYIPDYMKTANEISPEWHLKMQAAFQKHVDSSISKTINMSNSATKEIVDDIYMWAWKNKLKGITIYRDGSKENQPLNKIENPRKEFENNMDRLIKESITIQPTPVIVVHPEVAKELKEYRKRGPVTVGVTHKVDTGRGKIYITINYSEYHAEPVEVFIRLGHLSTPTESALAEYVGRLISLLLKNNVPIDFIARQGNKVYSDTTFWYNRESFCSFPKLISHLLQFTFEEALDMAELDFDSFLENGNEYYEENEEVVTENTDSTIGEFCYHCGTYGMIGEGGCMVCQNCGFEKCGG